MPSVMSKTYFMYPHAPTNVTVPSKTGDHCLWFHAVLPSNEKHKNSKHNLSGNL